MWSDAAKKHLLIIGGLAGGTAFWIAEAALHAFVFEEGAFVQHVTSPSFHEAWMRGLGAVSLFAFSGVAQYLLNRAEEAKRAAEEAKRELEGFLAHVSHELRGPAASIASCLDFVLGKKVFGEEERELLGAAKEMVDVLLARAADVTDYERIMEGKIAFKSSRVALRRFVPAIVAPLRLLAAKKGVSLVLDDCPGGYLEVDPLRLKQILINVIGNAIKFTPAGGQVRVSASLSGEDVRIAVADSGPGVPQEDAEAIFLPFCQGSGQKEQGLGLGLAISRQLAVALGGSLVLDADYSPGCRFFLSLPRPKSLQGRT